MEISRAIVISFLIIGVTNRAELQGWGADGPPPPSIRIEQLKQHVGFLSSDSLEGRQAGSRGGQAAAAYLVSELKPLGIQPAARFPGAPTTKADYQQEFGQNYRNLLALLPGSDPALTDDYLLIGAHYDHVGYGNSSNSRGPYGQIHNGADDNASGTAVLLEIIHALGKETPPLKRSLLFAFWDAEELGMLGSKYWLENLPRDARKPRLMINLDMVGRLRERRMVMTGWRSASAWRGLATRANQSPQLSLDFSQSLQADSDHWPFFAGRVPAVHLETGKHDDYHRPSDDAHRLNYEGLRQIGDWVVQLARDAANQPQLPEFRPAAIQEYRQQIPTPQGEWTEPPARLGITWDARLAEQKVIQVTAVNQGSPAGRAGIRGGDRLLQFGEWKSGLADELRATVQSQAGPVDVVVKREGESEPTRLIVELAEPRVWPGFRTARDDAVPEAEFVQGVVRWSVADRAGLKPGDYLLRINQQPCETSAVFQSWRNQPAAETILEVERRGQLHTIPLKFPADAPR